MSFYQNLLKPILLISILFSYSCSAKRPLILLPNGKQVNVKLAIKAQDQKVGLSGIKEEEFSKTDAMLFWYDSDELRQFWMPNTFFDLYIIFLNKDLKVLHIDKKAKAHPGIVEPPHIHRTGLIYSRYIFEMRADSKLAQSLKVGDILKWKYSKKISDLAK